MERYSAGTPGKHVTYVAVKPPTGGRTLRVPFCRGAQTKHDAKLLHIVEGVPDLVAFVDPDGFLEYLNPAGRRVLAIGQTEPCSRLHLADLHSPAAAARLEAEALPVARRDLVWRGASTLLTRTGREIPVAQTIVARHALDGRPGGAATLMRDVGTLKPGQAARRIDDRWFRLLFLRVTDGYALVDDRGVVVDANPQFARMLGCTRRGVIGRAFRDCVAIEMGDFESSSDSRDALANYHGNATLQCVDGRLVPVIVSVRKALAAGTLVARHCAIVTSIPSAGLGSPSPGETEDDRLCNSCHILNAQEAERKRVATELHDGLGQSLSVIKFRLDEALAKLDPGLAGEAVAMLHGLVPKVKGALEEVRRIAMNLRPSTLEDLGVLATLSWFLREYSSVYRTIVIDRTIEVGEDDVPDALKLPLFRIVQEAFNNAAKHAHATRISIRLRQEAGALRLVIEDNGVGFDPDEVAAREAPARTLGHAGMLDRVHLTNGNLTIETAPSAGVRIGVTWPRRDAD